MKAVIQRVSQARVVANGQTVSQIKRGLLVLLGIGEGDGVGQAEILAEKLTKLRIFADKEGKMNQSVVDIKGSVLVVSQFTLYGDTQKGNRPSFIKAAERQVAHDLYNQVVKKIKELGVPVKTGEFGAMMEVKLINDGPVTIIMEE